MYLRPSIPRDISYQTARSNIKKEWRLQLVILCIFYLGRLVLVIIRCNFSGSKLTVTPQLSAMDYIRLETTLYR